MGVIVIGLGQRAGLGGVPVIELAWGAVPVIIPPAGVLTPLPQFTAVLHRHKTGHRIESRNPCLRLFLKQKNQLHCWTCYQEMSLRHTDSTSILETNVRIHSCHSSNAKYSSNNKTEKQLMLFILVFVS